MVEKFEGSCRKGSNTRQDRRGGIGNFGDSEPVGEGISEMRIHVGPGYRVYYSRTGKVIYLLLCGGDKSTQKKDIELAKAILRGLEDEK